VGSKNVRLVENVLDFVQFETEMLEVRGTTALWNDEVTVARTVASELKRLPSILC
jgi:hypothetical protein